MFKYMKLKTYLNKLFLILSTYPMPMNKRRKLLSWGGVKLRGQKIYVGENVIFDRVYPENIIIGDRVRITANCVILTHYYDTSTPGCNFNIGKVEIEEDVFIGINVIICNSCIIGRGAVVGAGSIVTKDIPPFEVWAGNPARFIRKRDEF